MTSPLLSATSCNQENCEEVEYVEDFPPAPFLKEQLPQHRGKKTLVLDLDETLVHSTFQEVSDYQYVVPVEIEGDIYNVFVFLRPGALEFIERMSKLYEVIIYTASLSIVRTFILDMLLCDVVCRPVTRPDGSRPSNYSPFVSKPLSSERRSLCKGFGLIRKRSFLGNNGG